MWTAPLKGAFRFQFTVLSYLAVSYSKTILFFVSVPSSPGPLFQNEDRCSAFDMEIIFHSQANKTHFHKKGCAPSLILKVRVFGTRNWPIWLHFPGEKLFHMYKCRTCFHSNSVSFLPDCPTCSEFETLRQTVQDLKEQVANNKMQCIIIFRILAKYRNPAGLSRKKGYLIIPPFSRFVDYRKLLSFSYEIFRNIKGLEFNKCILF